MKFPATVLVHTVNGPTPCCDAHAKQVRALMSFMGGHTNDTIPSYPIECTNCVNEAMKF